MKERVSSAVVVLGGVEYLVSKYYDLNKTQYSLVDGVPDTCILRVVWDNMSLKL